MVDDLAGPLSYSAGWWWVLGVLALLPVLRVVARRVPGWVGVWSNRPGSRSMMRAQSLAAIAGIERRHSAGELTAREAHSELSRALREFVSRRTESRVEAMTLVELELELETGLDGTGSGAELLAAMRVFYDGAFDPRPSSVVTDSARLARKVVTGWN